MALDKVIKDILESARVEADKLVKEAEKELSAILREADEAAAKRKRVQERELEETLRRLRRQEISSAELEAKKIVLNAKKEILDRAFEQTLREISLMPPESKSKVYRTIIEGASRSVPRPRVLCPRKESPLLAGISGIGSVVEGDMESGIILESEDGSVRLDFRFRTILEGLWEREMKNVSTILFG